MYSLGNGLLMFLRIEFVVCYIVPINTKSSSLLNVPPN